MGPVGADRMLRAAPMTERAALLLDDTRLLAECRLETLRASGPGGQHRNKTESGVRLTHLPTGVISQAFERRSQHENRAVALDRLRHTIALTVRETVDLEHFEPSPALRAILPGAKPRIGPNNDRFWPGAAELLDVFVACRRSVADTAAMVGLSTGALARVLLSAPDLVATVNRLRAELGFAPLR